MGGPSSDFHALLVQRIAASTNAQMPAAAETVHEAVTRALALAEKEVAAMPVAAPAIPAAQLLPKDLLPALRKTETPKEAARLEVHDFIEFATGRNRTPLPQKFQTSSFFVTSTVNSFQMRKF